MHTSAQPEKSRFPITTRRVFFWAFATLTLLAYLDFCRAGLGSGHLFGVWSSKWIVLNLLAGAGFLATGVLLRVLLLREDRRYVAAIYSKLRVGTAPFRYACCVALVGIFLGLFYFTNIGLIFQGASLRIWATGIVVLVVAVLLEYSDEQLVSSQSVLLSAMLVSAGVVLMTQAIFVTKYPFKQYWSEGNRFWDYSTFFARDRYQIVGAQDFSVSLDERRGQLWGLPFLLIDQPTIWHMRLWDALLDTVPLVLLGCALFWKRGTDSKETSVIAGLLALIFLNQGPIYATLVIVAIIAVMANKLPFWAGIPLLLYASYYAETARLTWAPAPAMWFAILYFGNQPAEKWQAKHARWTRLIALSLAGLMAVIVSYLALPTLLETLKAGESTGPFSLSRMVAESFNRAMGIGNAATSILTSQPLEWGRLLPGGAFAPGILIALIVAVGPMVCLLVYVVRERIWNPGLVQLLIILSALFAFLAVGLVASAKVGGGLDLHNLDMFLIGMLLVAFIAWEQGIKQNLHEPALRTPTFHGLAFLLVFLPGVVPFLSARPLELPDPIDTQQALDEIQAYVTCAQEHGDVLFIDERQLITFGEVSVPLVPEYEKKRLMDAAMASDQEFLEPFYDDLQEQRFSLIISEQHQELIRDPGEGLAFENNAWVQWISHPLLEQYEQVSNNKKIPVELYLPLGREFKCP